MKKVLLTSLLLLLLGGCYDYREINDMAIVSGLAIYKGEGEEAYRAVIEIVSAKEGSQTSVSPIVVTQTGATISDTLSKATSASGKPLYFGHCQLLIVDYAIAQEGMKPILDFISRNYEMRLSMHVLVSKNIPYGKVFEEGEKSEVRSFQISRLIESENKQALMPNIRFFQFLKDLYEAGADGYVPLFLMDDNTPTLSGLAVFQNGKMVGELSQEYTKTLLLGIDDTGLGRYVLKRPYNDPQGNVSFAIRQYNCSIEPELKDGDLTVKIHFKGDFSITELERDQWISTEEDIKTLETQLSTDVRQKFFDLVEVMRINNQFDLFGLEKKLRHSSPKYTTFLDKYWPNVYRNAVFEINADCNIISTGRFIRRLNKQS